MEFGIQVDNKRAHTFSVNIFMFGLQTWRRNSIILLFVHVCVAGMHCRYISGQNATTSADACVFVETFRGA
jgi:hypothetical protein